MLDWLLTNRELWERPILDLWVISHFLTGFLIALLVRSKEINIRVGFLISLGVSILWELFEIISNISKVEFLSNQFADILFAQLGFFVAVLFFKKNTSGGAVRYAIFVFGSVFLIINILGWSAYRNYVSLF
jgi:hypothetical protein